MHVLMNVLVISCCWLLQCCLVWCNCHSKTRGSTSHCSSQLIAGVNGNQHVTATLCSTLHWLLILQHIICNIELMTFDCVWLWGQGPECFSDVLIHATGAWSDSCLLTKMTGLCCKQIFSVTYQLCGMTFYYDISNRTIISPLIFTRCVIVLCNLI